MTQLLQLPNELLANVLSYQDISFTVISLWKAGDALFTAKLVKSITHVDLKDTNWNSTSRWPQCLSKLLNLRYLAVDRSGGSLMGSSAQLSAEIRQLSPKLRSIQLLSNDAPEAFFNYADDRSTILSRYGKGYSRLFDMQAAFPDLEALHVEGALESEFGFEPCTIPAQDFPGLADSLTSLWLPSRLQVNPAHLPRQLLSIDNLEFTPASPSSSDEDDGISDGYAELSLELLSSLPPHLTRIERIEGLENAQHLLALPSSLDLLDSPIPWNYANSRAMLSRCAVRSMIIDRVERDSFDENWITPLPRTLTSLTLPARTLLGVRDILALPPLLTTLLEELEVDWEDCKAHELDGKSLVWPASLTTLELAYPTKPKHCRFLPSSLTGLYAREWQAEPGSLEPRGLNSTSFPHLKSLHFLPSPLVLRLESLPVGLTILHLGPTSAALKAEVGVLQHLPASLTQLRLYFDLEAIQSSEDMQFSVPSSLRDAKISHWHFSWLDKFPTGLEELTICYLLGFTAEAANLPDFTHALPNTLRRLNLEVDEAPPGTGALSGHPFSSLTSLELLDFDGRRFDSSILRHLPRKLWYLMIPLENLNAEDCLFLPPYLHTFRVVSDIARNHTYLVDLVPVSIVDDFIWDKHNPDLVARFAARASAAEARSRLYPDPRTLATASL